MTNDSATRIEKNIKKPADPTAPGAF